MPDLDLSALRKVAEAARESMEGAHAFEAHLGPETVLALLDELERLRASAVMEYGVARREPILYVETLSRSKEAAEAFVRNPPIGYERPDGYVVIERQKAGPWREAP